MSELESIYAREGHDVFNAVENATDKIVANKKFNFATDGKSSPQCQAQSL